MSPGKKAVRSSRKVYLVTHGGGGVDVTEDAPRLCTHICCPLICLVFYSNTISLYLT